MTPEAVACEVSPGPPPCFGHSDYVRRFHAHHQHVIQVGTGIDAGYEQAIETVDKSTEGAKFRFGFISFGITDDYTLTSAIGKACCCALVGHATCEAQNISHGVCFRFVGPHAYAAGGRTERSIVNGDNGFESKCLLLAEENVFVIVSFHEVEDEAVHAAFSWAK